MLEPFDGGGSLQPLTPALSLKGRGGEEPIHEQRS